MKKFASSMSITSLAITGIVGLAMAQPASASSDDMTVETEMDDVTNGREKITDRRHPDYVRCRKEPIMGSLARTRKICMTNAEWAAYARKGNADTRQFVDGTAIGTSDSRFPIAPMDSSRP